MPLARFITPVVFLLFCCAVFSPLSAEPERVDSPFYGGVLFQFNQQNYFSSIIELEKSLELNQLGEDKVRAEALLGSLYLSYGLHRHAQNIFEQMLDSNIDGKSRDLAWFYLGKIQYQRGLYEQAKIHLGKANTFLPARLEDERLTLMALVLLQSNDLEGAIAHLNQIVDEGTDLNYSRYNLAVAMLTSGKPGAAMRVLREAATAKKVDAESAALIDRIDIALGFHYLEQQQFAQAKSHFNKVELHGPFSTQALLGLGWAAFGANDFGSAKAAWRELVTRDSADTSVLEGYLALPFLSYHVQNYNASLADYQNAIDVYKKELEWLDRELERDDFSEWVVSLLDLDSKDEIGWHWQNEALSDSLLNRYMQSFAASHTFQEMLKNYRDLMFVEKNINKWLDRVEVYENIIDVKTAAYASLIPEAKQKLDDLSDESMIESIEMLRKRIKEIERAEDALALVTTQENETLGKLRSIDYRLSKNLDEFRDKLNHLKLVDRAVGLQKKHDLLDGLLKWEMMTTYKARLWQVKKGLAELESEHSRSIEKGRDIQTVMQAVPQSFDTHRQRLDSTTKRLKRSLSKVVGLRIQHEAFIQAMIKEELLAVKRRIEVYRSQALLSVAHIYDLGRNVDEVAP